MLKPRFLDFFCQRQQSGYREKLEFRDSQPSQRIRNILMMSGIVMPEAWIFAPQTADQIVVLKFF